MAPDADEMEVARMSIRRFESRAALAEGDLPRDPRGDHPLQGPVHRRAADPRIFAMNERADIVSTQVPFLAQEDAQDTIAFAGTFAARGTQARDVRKAAVHNLPSG